MPQVLACTISITAPQSGSTLYLLQGAELAACDPSFDQIFGDSLGNSQPANYPAGAGSYVSFDDTSGYNPANPAASYINIEYHGDGSGGGTTRSVTFYTYNTNYNIPLQANTVMITLTAPTPVVSAISPSSGPGAGGTSVTISGSDFLGTSAVKFGTTNATGYVVNNAAQITATAPAGTGTVDVTVTTGGGTSATSAADRYTYISAPTISSVSPNVGTTTGGTSVTVTGTNFTGVTAVKFGSTTASFTVNSATQITATAPAGAAGSVDITVTTAGGTSATSAADVYTYVSTPTITSISPTSGSTAGGSTVVISGTNFAGASAVAFGGTSATGFTINSNTQITATSPAASAGTVDVRVTSVSGTSATSAADQFTYVAPAVAGAASATVAHGSSNNNITLNISGGTASSVTVASGAAHGTATASGTNITYTPSAAYSGADSFTYTATNAAGTSSAATVSITVSNATISYAPASPTAGTVGAAYSQTLATAGGGTAPYSYAITSGSLPAGLSLASNGTLSGTPTAAGNFNFTVAATDSSTGTGPFSGTSGTLSLTIAAPTITLSPSTLTAATVGAATSQTITASGGTGSYSYAVTAGSLPAGLSLSSGGVLSGTPTAGGSFNFTVTATDSSSGTGSPFTGNRAYTLTVNTPTIAIAPGTLTSVAAGASVSATLTASGGTSTYSYAVTAGSLPPGLTLSSVGTLSGTATAVGSYNFTVTATDSTTGSGPYTGSKAYSWTVSAPVLTISPVSGSNLSGSALSAYSQAFTPSGGTAPYTYGIAVNSGSMPTGLSFSTSTGTLSGTPTSGGTVNFTVTATAATTGVGAPYSVSGTYNLTIGAPTVVVAPAGSIANPVIGTAYSQSFTASGGATPYGYVISAGALPAGLSLSAAGVLTGTPTAAGTYNFTVQATDTNNFVGTHAYAITIAAPTLATTPTTLPNGNVSTAYSQTIGASGGTAPYTYAVTAGALPTGLSLNSTTGVISGTPTTVNTFNFTVTATDSTTGTGAPFSASRAYTVVTSMQTPVAGTKTANTISNTPVQIDLAPVITGGAPDSVAVSSAPAHGNTVVAGLKVTYTPAPGYFGPDSFSYTATNVGGTSAAATVTITVASPLPAPTVKPVNISVEAGSSNNTIPLDITGTASGVAISAPAGHGTATVNGTAIRYSPAPGYVGTDTFVYTAYNDGGTSNAAIVTVTIVPKVALPTAGNVNLTVLGNSKANPVTLNLGGGAATNVTVAVAPSHGTVTVSGSTASYTPAEGYAGVDSFSYTASNAAGTSAPAIVTITVTQPVPVVHPVSSSVNIGSNNNLITLPVDGAVLRIEIVKPPQHGKVTVNAITASSSPAMAADQIGGLTVTYTPDAGYSGPDSFSYVAINAAGRSAEATVTLQVMPPPPVVGVVTATVLAGKSVTLDVAAQATGGPFTGLTIAAQPAAGAAAVQGTNLVYTAPAGYSGKVVITYLLSNAYGASQGTATITVDARPDPTKDTEVTGLMSAQAESARRFADAQTNNFTRRMESLHGDGWANSSFGLSLAPTSSSPNRNEVNAQQANATPSVSTGTFRTGDAPATTRKVSSANATQDHAASVPADERRSLGLWVSGNVDFGQSNSTNAQQGHRFHTDGVSVGADYRYSQLLSLGAGAGLGRDVSDVGSSGSKSKASNNVLALYGTLRPADRFFVDGLLGYSTLSYDLWRYQSGSNTFATGSRKGSQVFGALVGGYEWRGENWLISPSGRLDAMRTTLEGYTESATVNALAFNEQRLRSSSAALGVRLQGRQVLAVGQLEPMVRLEYRYHFSGADIATLRYADLSLGDELYSATFNQAQREQWLISLGSKLRMRNGVLLSIDYTGGLNNSAGYSHAVRAGVEMGF